MNWKAFATISLILGIISSFAYIVRADCHNTESCEDYVNHLWSGDLWMEDEGNTVDYYTNPRNDRGRPSFVEDCKNAAKTWTSVQYKGIRIAFKLRHKGDTRNAPKRKDGKNVVGFIDMGTNWNPAGVFTWMHDTPANRIKEQDVVINSYHCWNVHGRTHPYQYCYRNVLTHEFGHFVKLLDLWDDFECDPYFDCTMREGVTRTSIRKKS